MKRSFTHCVIFIVFALRLITLSSCANIIPPGGGLRDSLPPRLVNASPKDSAVNVSVKNIILTFDEYIQTLQNVNDNLIISPTMKDAPIVDAKLRNVTIKIKDTLEPNTTYTFDFGDAIKDVNEGNVAKGISYVFSTGNTIDNNTYSGKVLLAESGKVDSGLIVVLHRNLDDSAVARLRPRYYARVNGQGQFAFKHLPMGTFAVYVMDGVNNFLRRYDDSTRKFGFRSAPVTISGNTRPDTLFAYEEFKRKEKITPVQVARVAATNKDDRRLRYTTDLENGQQDILSNLGLTFNRKLASFDSTRFVLYDTSYHRISDYHVSLDTGKMKVRLSYNWKESTFFRLIIAKDAVADTSGTTITKADTLRFITKREADYGSIRLRFTNLDLSKNPVLQFVQNEKLVESFPLSTGELVRKRYRPGTYELRILFDTNRNGIWDPGHFFGSRRQPEIVRLISRQLVIRSNWDNEVTINL